ncbi:MAG: hypothetical protein M1821_009331 [Bathelium mastoideum]|nr:MAG: hypothetical protein M1821_009331 [Bathelium mastoideum]KAI9686949.1 MAG: hypothetical protein M1822_002702 [Bathelium mastoideum]
MGPPPLPLSPSGGSVPARNRRPSIPAPLSPPLHSTVGGESGGIPMRHPQPRTAAELYGEMEKEQEGIVNRLTRELSQLRAQTASAASNASASSTSTTSTNLPSAAADPHSTLLTGPTHPTPSRRHRSSSSLSRTSATAAIAGLHSSSLEHARLSSAIAGSNREYPAPPPPSSARAHSGSLSTAGTAATSNTTAAAGSSGVPSAVELQRQPSAASATSVASGRSALPSPSLTSARVAEAARERAELETAKAENAVLRERVRELERVLREQGRG